MALFHGGVVHQMGVRFLFGMAARGTAVANHSSYSCGGALQEGSSLILLLYVPLCRTEMPSNGYPSFIMLRVPMICSSLKCDFSGECFPGRFNPHSILACLLC